MDDIPRKMGIPDWEFRIVIGTTKIDYDLDKEYSNREKHGYSLESRFAARANGVPVWRIAAEHDQRWLHGGRRGSPHAHERDDSGKVVLMVTTMRADETVRIMSFRRASEEEREQFYQHTGFRERA